MYSGKVTTTTTTTTNAALSTAHAGVTSTQLTPGQAIRAALLSNPNRSTIAFGSGSEENVLAGPKTLDSVLYSAFPNAVSSEDIEIVDWLQKAIFYVPYATTVITDPGYFEAVFNNISDPESYLVKLDEFQSRLYDDDHKDLVHGDPEREGCQSLLKEASGLMRHLCFVKCEQKERGTVPDFAFRQLGRPLRELEMWFWPRQRGDISVRAVPDASSNSSNSSKASNDKAEKKASKALRNAQQAEQKHRDALAKEQKKADKKTQKEQEKLAKKAKKAEKAAKHRSMEYVVPNTAVQPRVPQIGNYQQVAASPPAPQDSNVPTYVVEQPASGKPNPYA